MTKILGKLYEVCFGNTQFKICEKQLHKDCAEVELARKTTLRSTGFGVSVTVQLAASWYILISVEILPVALPVLVDEFGCMI